MLLSQRLVRNVPLKGVPKNTIRHFASGVSDMKKTVLYDLHTELGGKMVPFSGYAMPVQYPEGVLKSHNHTRADNCSSLFDVSHMGQLKLTGKDRVSFLESLVVGDIAGLGEGQGCLSLITNERGGIIDDTVITNAGDHIYMVVNAGNKDIDLIHMNKHLEAFGGDCQLEVLDDRSLVAIQGPGAADVLQKYCDLDLVHMDFMTSSYCKVENVAGCIVTRCGYTGEDGFEISIPNDEAVRLTKVLLGEENVLAAGLGARDSLRLEAGLCLHGHDIGPDITPSQGALNWTIGARRKAEGGFTGADVILKEIEEKSTPKKRVGFFVEGAPAREGAKIFCPNGEEQIGIVTSGTMSPTLKKPIAMGYVQKGYFKAGSKVTIEVQKKMVPAVVTKMPFVEARYYRTPK